MYSLEIKNLEKIQGLVTKYPAVSAKHFGEAISRILLTVQRYATTGAPVDTGKLRASWNLNIGIFRGALKNTAEYAADVEEGRAPGKEMTSSEVKSILKWAERKGLPPWGVLTNIRKFGTKPQPFFAPSVEMGEAIADFEFQRAMNNTLANLVK